jgi:hypothetical protein
VVCFEQNAGLFGGCSEYTLPAAGHGISFGEWTAECFQKAKISQNNVSYLSHRLNL